MPPPQLLSIVVPCHDEEETAPELHRRLIAALAPLGLDFELIFVDDGSRDATLATLLALNAQDARVKIVALSRNFGHQPALTAGIDAARGDAVVLIDADLQDPPELIADMVAKWREGNDVVYARRLARRGEPAWKVAAAKAFYRLVQRMAEVPWPLDTGEFRLMDRRVVDVIRGMRERVRVLRAMSTWVGFRQVEVTFERPERFAGHAKYGFFTLCRLAFAGIISSSLTPLRALAALGGGIAALALAALALLALVGLAGGGWAGSGLFLFLGFAVLSGLNLLGLGVLGAYVGTIHGQTQDRPLYVVDKRVGFETQDGR